MDLPKVIKLCKIECRASNHLQKWSISGYWGGSRECDKEGCKRGRFYSFSSRETKPESQYKT